MKNEYQLLKTIAKIKLKRHSGEEFWTTIDLEDFEKVSNMGLNWRTKYVKETNSYYAVASYKKECGSRRVKYLHRIIMDANDEDIIDHVNHDTLNNRKSNLRYANKMKNARNRSGLNSNNTTGYRNVSYIKSEGKHIVQLQIDGKNTRLGAFDDMHEAGKFAKEMREKYYGKFAGRG